MKIKEKKSKEEEIMKNKVKTMSVFCGSAMPTNSIYIESIRSFGAKIAQKGIRLVYGGASVGLMGEVANAAINKGGEVIGVFPTFFNENEIAHKKLNQQIYVSSMSERKQVMAEMSDAFIIFPGGYGTLDEMYEMLTYSQLDFHKKPVIIANINGFYEHLIEQMKLMHEEGFIRNTHFSAFAVANSVDEIFEIAEKHIVINDDAWLKWAKNN